MMRSDDIDAFVRCLCHKEMAETGARVSENAGMKRLLYRNELAWQWPRAFRYLTEYFFAAPADPAAALADAAHDGVEHVVNLFHPDIDDIARYLDAGHTLAWLSTLMARDLDQPWLRDRGLVIWPAEVRTAEEKAIADSLRGISNPASAPTCIHDTVFHRHQSADEDRAFAVTQKIGHELGSLQQQILHIMLWRLLAA